MPRFATPRAFARDVREQGLAYLRHQPGGRCASPGQWGTAAFWTTAFGLSVALLLSTTGPPGFLWCALAGLFAFFMLATLCHDAAHGSLSRHAGVNRTVLTLGFGLFGVSGALWRWRHIRLHHMFPNVEGTDIDGEGSLLIRVAPYGPWRVWHRAQALYAPLLYALLMAHLAWIEDWKNRAMARRMAPELFATRAATIEFLLVKLLHAALALGLPWLVLQPPLWALVLGYLIYTGVASVLFIVIVAGSHLSEEAEFVSPQDGQIAHDWAAHQLRTCLDWAPQSRAAALFSSGSNAHTAHHLFPQVAHCHNAALSEIVSDAAARHGLTHNITSFAGLILSHVQHLHALGRCPALPDPQTKETHP
ncbi:fatty acid desaturase family protein [Roseobacter sinensis]|uniref:Fatty acid desaturase n=1 Tax=Roseobacter sinensis TaxID=2931391 RepID=A0ABT3BFK1_9RHOB|nr:fatty acid desaturase [Roseobacter sp. WL0113]MCV3272358.1 fatty acid desaturase [Roseobacter sp. WL0113]